MFPHRLGIDSDFDFRLAEKVGISILVQMGLS
jgi:hypothetical protein